MSGELRGHRLAGEPQVGPADLAHEPFLVTEPGCSYREMYDRTLGAADPAGTADADIAPVDVRHQPSPRPVRATQ